MSAMPIRVQLRRIAGWSMPPNTVAVCRPTKWGNPHYIGVCPLCGVEHTASEAVAEFEAEIAGHPELQAAIVRELRGKNLACWCPPARPCHADVLLMIANEVQP